MMHARKIVRSPSPPPLLVAIITVGLTAWLASSSPVDASVSYALSLDDVAKGATLVVRATPIEQISAWEDGRIVTSTRLRVERVVAGAGARAGSVLSVRTLGGVVGAIGQSVEGEAQFVAKTPSILFLTSKGAPESALAVQGRAQGQLVIALDQDGKSERVHVRKTGTLIARRPAASASASPLMTWFDGHSVERATTEAARAWEQTHAR